MSNSLVNAVWQRRIRGTIWVLSLKINPDTLGYGVHATKTYPFISISLTLLLFNITLVITDTHANPILPRPPFWFFLIAIILTITFSLIPALVVTALR